MNKLDINKHVFCSLSHKKALIKLCEPLFKSSLVKYFSYNRFYRDQKWIGLYTDTEPVEKTLAMDQGPLFVDAHGVSIEAGVYFHGDIKEILKTQVHEQHVDGFFAQNGNPKGQIVVQNGLLIIRKSEHYDESFYFSMYDESIAASRAYYHQSLTTLKKFCVYFLHKCKDVIEAAEKHKITYAIPPSGNTVFSQCFWQDQTTQFNSTWFDTRKFCVGTPFGDVFLSAQELNCLRLIAQGHTYNEIAEHLSLHI